MLCNANAFPCKDERICIWNYKRKDQTEVISLNCTGLSLLLLTEWTLLSTESRELLLERVVILRGSGNEQQPPLRREPKGPKIPLCIFVCLVSVYNFLYLSSEFSAPGCCWFLEQTGGLFLSLSFSGRLEGKVSMYSNKAGVDGGASKTL